MANAPFVGFDGDESHEHHVAPRNESIGRCVGWLGLVHLDAAVGEGTMCQLADQRNVEKRERYSGFFGDLSGYLYFESMFLPVCEADGFYRFELFHCPEQAGSGILSAGKADQCGFFFFCHTIKI